jgi:hypothetical protein
MLRREFISFLCTTAAAWPLAASAQQTERVRRIGVLMALSEADRDARAWLFEFKRGLVESGWTDGGNIRLDIRWAGSNVDLMSKFAKETGHPESRRDPRKLHSSYPRAPAAKHRRSQSYSQLLATH